MIYTVFSTSHSPYMQWQSELLEYSWKQVGQQGELIRLVATDGQQPLPTHRYAKIIATQAWDIHPLTGDNYAIYNKPASLLEWLYTDRPDGTVLLLDPDCVFRAPINREVAVGCPAAQTWIDFYLPDSQDSEAPFGLDPRFAFLSRHCVNPQLHVQGMMIPTLIHTQDLRRIVLRWLELTGLIRQEVRDQAGHPMRESDMFGYIIAAAEYGLTHELGHFGICTNWLPDAVPNAPIIHFCQPIVSQSGEAIWAKGTYQPWGKVDSPARAKDDYGRDLLTILNNFVDMQENSALERTVRPKRRDGVLEGRVRDEMLLFSSEREDSFSLNASGQDIWELCDGSHTVGDISHELQRRYACTESDLFDDLTTAILKLREIGMLEFEAA